MRWVTLSVMPLVATSACVVETTPDAGDTGSTMSPAGPSELSPTTPDESTPGETASTGGTTGTGPDAPAGTGAAAGTGGSTTVATGGAPSGGTGGASSGGTGGAMTGSTGGASRGGGSTIDPTELRDPELEGFGAGTTGGDGGAIVYATTGTEINRAMCERAADDTPLIIMVQGTINHENTESVSGSCDTREDEIQFKRVSNISLIGVGDDAVFDEIGIHLRETSNIIIQNIHIRNVKKSGSPTSNGGDAIGMEVDVSQIWVDHCTLEASGGESDGYDSLLDMKAGVTNVTVSYNLFRDSSRAGLVGSSDSDDANTDITFHHNWYLNIEQRTPLLRHGLAHSYNNYWSNEDRNSMIHGINSRMGARILVEGNYFDNTNNPLLASDDSDEPGCWQTGENTVTPEVYYSRSVGDGALVIPGVVDGQLQSTCDVNVPYSYGLDASSQIPDIVSTNAGVGKID